MPWSLLLLLALVLVCTALRLACRRRRRTAHSVLPGAPAVRASLLRNTHWKVSTTRFSVRLQTTVFNDAHDAAAAALAKPVNAQRRRLLIHLYDVGSVLGVVGALGSVLLLLWTAFRLGASLFYPTFNAQPTPLARRELTESTGSRSSSIPLQLIVPGVTVPLSHLPLLLLALITAQTVHEAGHAVAAALETVPLLSVGLSMTFLLPSAFVGLSSHARPPPLARLRIASAGAFHNLLFWLLLLASTRALAALDGWAALGYTDVAAWGRVVTAVAQDSALRAHLPPGTVVTQLDDMLLARASPGADLWTTYLSAPPSAPHAELELGWCVAHAWFLEQPRACCDTEVAADGAEGMCYVAAPPGAVVDRCIDPLHFIEDEGADAIAISRCDFSAECGVAQVCVRQRRDQELLRVTVRLPSWLGPPGGHALEKVVLWSGPRSELLEDVEVGTRLPQARILPLGLPRVVDVFFGYLGMLSLSLYFFNLAPLPALDGVQVLDALLELWDGSGPGGTDASIDLAALERGQSVRVQPVVRPTARIRRAVQGLTGALVGVCMLLGLLHAVGRW